MRMSDETAAIDQEDADKLADKLTEEIRDVIVRSGADPNDGVVLYALLDSVAWVIENIGCAGCRQVKTKAIQKQLPVMLRAAMKDAAENDQMPSQHMH
jgi:hypothetical protein